MTYIQRIIFTIFVVWVEKAKLMAKPKVTKVAIKKADSKLQVIYGEVYIPDVPDTDGDFMSKEQIIKTAHNFLKIHKGGYVNQEHEIESPDSCVVESFVARDCDDIFVPGSWVVGVHIPDDDTWGLVEKGEINGFSMEGFGFRTQKVVDIDFNEVIKGETVLVEEHTHTFEIQFSETGTFLGGETDYVNGHKHLIKKGTATETAEGHSHAYHFIEVWANVEQIED
jgi:hypothetical protein